MVGDDGLTAAGGAPPALLDLTIDNITPNTIRINDQTENDRLRYLMARLVTHLHDFARETRLSNDEWMTALQFLIATGQICTDVRNVSLYSLSLSSLVSPRVARGRECRGEELD